MPASDAVLVAVLRTLVRATVDPRECVVLRARQAARAVALAEWLASVHGSRRVVIASTTARAAVVVRLPIRPRWPRWAADDAALASVRAGRHISEMTLHEPDRRVH